MQTMQYLPRAETIAHSPLSVANLDLCTYAIEPACFVAHGYSFDR